MKKILTVILMLLMLCLAAASALAEAPSVPVKSVSVAEPKLSLPPGESWEQAVFILPADATDKALEWQSSDEHIAAVDGNGVITAVSAGKCSITGTVVNDPKKKISVAVEVKDFDVMFRSASRSKEVDFDTRDSWHGSVVQVNSHKQEANCIDIIVGYPDGIVCEGDKEYTLYPTCPGAGTVCVTIKEDEKKILSDKQYTVFVSQQAILPPDDRSIGRLPAESWKGHTYQIFSFGCSWDLADYFCRRHGGHLVTITGKDEQAFLESYLDKVKDKKSYWIGLNTGRSTKFTKWITGEKLSYTNWMKGNPDRFLMHAVGRIASDTYTDHTPWTMDRGTWDDEGAYYGYIAGFVCEWDTEDSPFALPEN